MVQIEYIYKKKSYAVLKKNIMDHAMINAQVELEIKMQIIHAKISAVLMINQNQIQYIIIMNKVIAEKIYPVDIF